MISIHRRAAVDLGVVSQGERIVASYDRAEVAPVFETGSITKTFTGLILAQMVVQKKVTLDEPRVRLPPGVSGIVRSASAISPRARDLALALRASAPVVAAALGAFRRERPAVGGDAARP